MLTKEEQTAVLRKVQSMQRNFHFRRLKVAKGEMSAQRAAELGDRDEAELRSLLKGVPA